MTGRPALIAFAHVGKSFDGGPGAKTCAGRQRVSLDVAEGEFSPSSAAPAPARPTRCG